MNQRDSARNTYIRDSQGVQIGGQQYNSWRVVLNPKVAVLALALLAVLAATVLWLQPWAAAADVRLAAYSVAVPSSVDGVDFTAGEVDGKPFREDQQQDPVPVTPVDITLKNNGAASAVVVGAVVTVVYAEYLDDCSQTGGSLQVEANYDVELPLDPPPRPFTARADMHFEVRPHTAERFTLTIGPKTQGIESWDARIYVADVSLKLDYASEPLRVGRAAWVTRSGDGYNNLGWSLGGDADCLRGNAAKMARFDTAGGTRSAEAATLIRRFAHLTAADGGVRTPTCASAGGYDPNASIRGLCALYTDNFVYAQVEASPDSAWGRRLRLRMSTRDGTVRSQVSCVLTKDAHAVEVPVARPGARAGGADPCSDTSLSGTVRIYAYPTEPLTDGELVFSADLADAPAGAEGPTSVVVKRSG